MIILSINIEKPWSWQWIIWPDSPTLKKPFLSPGTCSLTPTPVQPRKHTHLPITHPPQGGQVCRAGEELQEQLSSPKESEEAKNRPFWQKGKRRDQKRCWKMVTAVGQTYVTVLCSQRRQPMAHSHVLCLFYKSPVFDALCLECQHFQDILVFQLV